MRNSTKAFLLSVGLALVFGVLLLVTAYLLACTFFPPEDGSGHHYMPVPQIMWIMCSLLISLTGSFIFMVLAYYKIRKRLG